MTTKQKARINGYYWIEHRGQKQFVVKDADGAGDDEGETMYKSEELAAELWSDNPDHERIRELKRELAEEVNQTAANHLERGHVAEYNACRKHAEQIRFAQPVAGMKGRK